MYCTQKIKISEDVMQKKNIFRSGILLSGLIAASIIAGGCAKKEQKKAKYRKFFFGLLNISKKNTLL